MKTRFAHAASFGVLAAIAAIAFGLIIYMIGTGVMSAWNYLSYVIALVIFGVGAKKWRDQNGGALTFGQAYVYTLIAGVIYAVIIAIWTYVFMALIAPGAIEDMLLMMELEWEKQGLSQSQIDSTLEMTRNFFTPVSMTIWALIMNLIIFAIFNLISAAIVKKDPPPTPWTPPADVPFPNYPPQQ